MHKKIVLSLLTVFFVAALQGQAFIDYQVAPPSDSGGRRNSVFIGESFTTNASAAFISSLDIYANRDDSDPASFTLSLYAVTGSAGNYTPGGSALYSNTFPNIVLGDTNGTHHLFDELNWSVTGGTTYMVAFEAISGGSLRWQTASSSDTDYLISGYTGQNRYVNHAVAPGAYGAMTVTTSAIPEPSAYAVLAGAAALLLAFARRRRAIA